MIIRRLAIVLAVGLVPTMAVQFYNLQALHQARTVEVRLAALRQAELAGSEIQRIVEGVRGIMTAVGQAPSVRAMNTELCSPYVKQLVAKLENIDGISVVDSSGQVRCAASPEQLAINIRDRDYFQDSLKTTELVTGIYLMGRISKRPTLPFALPLIAEDGQHIGAVIASLNLDWLSDQMLLRGMLPNGSITVADRNGVILARQPQPEKFVGASIPEKFMYLLTEKQAGVIDVVSQDGTARLLGYVPLQLRPAGLYVSAGIGKSDAFASVDKALWRQAIITIAAIFASLCGAWLVAAHYLLKPLKKLLLAVRQVQSGDLSARTGMTREQGEPGEIGQEFDRALEQVDQREMNIDVLMRELAHRSKNQLAVLMGLINQLARRQSSVPAFKDALLERLHALSASQDLLLQLDGQQVELGKLVQVQLNSFLPAKSMRIQMAGPALTLPPDSVRSLGMAIHELATNATKHGALSNATGQVAIQWSSVQGHHEFIWREHGGPPVAAPQTSGFGRTLIEKIVPQQLDGRAELQYLPDGVKWTLHFQ